MRVLSEKEILALSTEDNGIALGSIRKKPIHLNPNSMWAIGKTVIKSEKNIVRNIMLAKENIIAYNLEEKIIEGLKTKGYTHISVDLLEYFSNLSNLEFNEELIDSFSENLLRLNSDLGDDDCSEEEIFLLKEAIKIILEENENGKLREVIDLILNEIDEKYLNFVLEILNYEDIETNEENIRKAYELVKEKLKAICEELVENDEKKLLKEIENVTEPFILTCEINGPKENALIQFFYDYIFKELLSKTNFKNNVNMLIPVGKNELVIENISQYLYLLKNKSRIFLFTDDFKLARATFGNYETSCILSNVDVLLLQDTKDKFTNEYLASKTRTFVGTKEVGRLSNEVNMLSHDILRKINEDNLLLFIKEKGKYLLLEIEKELKLKRKNESENVSLKTKQEIQNQEVEDAEDIEVYSN